MHVCPTRKIEAEIGDSRAGNNLLKYLEKLGVETIVVENNYIDRDYLIDYSGFHSHLFDNIPRFTKRVHLFSKKFNEDDLKEFLQSYSEERKSEVYERLGEYLGFFIIKPIKNLNGKGTPIGRSLLSVPDKSKECRFAIDDYKANFYGVSFDICTLPFQTKDHAVGLCATVSLWVLTKKMSKIFKTPLLSPYEITRKATRNVETSRNTPYDGLTLRQMVSFFKDMGVDYNIINIEQFATNLEFKDLVVDAIKAFIYSTRLPIIANLTFYIKDIPTDAHSVVICGYMQDREYNINKLFIHDDEIGPFTEVNSAPCDRCIAFSKWDYDWVKDTQYNLGGKKYTPFKYDEIHLSTLLVPFNPAIKLSFNEIYPLYRKFKNTENIENAVLYLATIRDFKSQVLVSKSKDKLLILEQAMPRFLWIMSSFEHDIKKLDIIYDATAHYIRCVGQISYE